MPKATQSRTRPLAPFADWVLEVPGDFGPAQAFLGWFVLETGGAVTSPSGRQVSQSELAFRLGDWDVTQASGGTAELRGPAGQVFRVRFHSSSTGFEEVSDAGAWAWGGLASITGDPDGPPLAPGAPLASLVSALYAALAFSAGRFAGTPDINIAIDLADVMASLIEVFGLKYAAEGVVRERAGDWGGLAGWGLYHCADGAVALALRDHMQLLALGEALDLPELQDSRYEDFMWGLCAEVDEVNAILASRLLDLPAAEVVDRLISSRIAVSRARPLLDMLRDEHLSARSSFARRQGVLLPTLPFRLRSEGESPPHFQDAAHPPLAGVRILDMSSVWAGPLAARLLADLGATVVKLVRPNSQVGFFQSGEEWNRDFYAILNDRNKSGHLVDLTTESGRAWLRKEVARADVLFENFAVGSLERAGFGHRVLHEINPRTVVVAMPALGLEGPNARSVGYGATIEQAAGIGWLYSDESGNPHRSGINFSDPIAGLWGAIGALLGLSGSRDTCVVELSQQEASLSLMIGPLARAQVDDNYQPRAVSATSRGSAWSMASRKATEERDIRVRTLDEVVGTPDAPGSIAACWVRHPDGRDYPLVGLPWTGTFAGLVPLIPVEMPEEV